jgi:hypothetical protein
VIDIDEPDENTDDGDYFGKHLSKFVEFLLERCLLVDLTGNRFMDVTNSGSFARCNYDSLSCSIYNRCALLRILPIRKHLRTTYKADEGRSLQKREYSFGLA